MKVLAGKTALITGGSDGIGLGIAEAFAQQGANLILVGRDAKKLTQREKELSRYGTDNLVVISQDMAARDAAREIAGKIAEKHIRIDILVNNAGIGRFIPFADSDASVLDFHLDLNVRAPYLLTRMFLNDLIASQGNVINISSYFARRMLTDRPSTAYSLTKAPWNPLPRHLPSSCPGGSRECGRTRHRFHAPGENQYRSAR
ncbi:SDR family NAD(P)-dependent oxidoreductase [Desulfosarcina cetonica]|uniref:SDR family NAD(P)-dependent oxidoreductase n=1 Tax=Desulfosarcina cetonica TaxID=90730 RepID=UPI001C43DEBA|nr:SDR family NAD(P)-dependent oxidoreductase [Desulfosarcina cetonica]